MAYTEKAQARDWPTAAAVVSRATSAGTPSRENLEMGMDTLSEARARPSRPRTAHLATR
jgi:hypothetical protein